MTTPIFKRILLKLSGEALAATQGFGVDPLRIHEIAAELADVHSLGVQIAIVVGGGNFFRGVAEQARDMDRVSADHMGMLPPSSMPSPSRMHSKSRASTPACSP